ncbi:MAG: 4-(cytidine 5'-diphospho)-2-C-methyl-D-erythritol kinase [Thermoleophilia bacterium]
MSRNRNDAGAEGEASDLRRDLAVDNRDAEFTPASDDRSVSGGTTSELPEVVEVAAPAKVNLALLVGPLRADGYHEIFSLMLPVTLADLVTVRLTPGYALSVNCAVCPGEGNLAARAVHELEKRLERSLELAVTITKRIPSAAGLGGGSSDAAATIIAVERLLGLELPTKVKYEVASAVGADVPFFFWPGAQIAMGRGNVLRAAPLPQPLHLVIAVPDVQLPTAQVYRWHDELAPSTLAEFAPRTARLVSAVDALAEPAGVAGLIENDLEAPVKARHVEVVTLLQRLDELGALAAGMSGSGSAVFGLFADDAAAAAARNRLASGPLPARVFYVTDVQVPPRPVPSQRSQARAAAEAAKAERAGRKPRDGERSHGVGQPGAGKTSDRRGSTKPPAAAPPRPKRSGRRRPPKGAA